MERSSDALTGRRRQIGSMPPSPLLLRRRSGSSSASIMTPESSSRRYSSSQRFVNDGRSKSTSKSRTKDNEENINLPATTATSRKFQDSRDSKRATSVTKSPSAWALSPGLSLGSPLLGSPAEPAAKVKDGRGSSGAGKVLKYFNRKKVSSVDEDYHRFRILHNRLMQWSFVNARAMAAMATSKRVAEADVKSLYQATSTAIKVMESIEQVITQYQTQLEKILYQVTELTALSKQELLATILMIATLMENEKSVRMHLIQRSMELKNGRLPRIEQSCV